MVSTPFERNVGILSKFERKVLLRTVWNIAQSIQEENLTSGCAGGVYED